MHLLGLQRFSRQESGQRVQKLEGSDLGRGVLHLTKCFVPRRRAEMYLALVIRPADGSLRGECAQEG